MTVDIIKSRLFVVDAFTSRKHKNLKGNPAGVLITSQPLSDEKAIEIAKWVNPPILPANHINDASYAQEAILTSFGYDF